MLRKPRSRLPFFRSPGRRPGSIHITDDELGALQLVKAIAETIIERHSETPSEKTKESEQREKEKILPAPPERAERPSPDVEEVVDRIWKEYFFEIDSAVGTIMLKYLEIESLAAVMESCDLERTDPGHMKNCASVILSQLRNLFISLNALTGDLVPTKDKFMEEILTKG